MHENKGLNLDGTYSSGKHKLSVAPMLDWTYWLAK